MVFPFLLERERRHIVKVSITAEPVITHGSLFPPQSMGYDRVWVIKVSLNIYVYDPVPRFSMGYDRLWDIIVMVYNSFNCIGVKVLG